MKKIITRVAVLTLALCLISCSAMAAGKLNVTQENFHIQDSYSVYGYTFAKVKNTGDKDVEFSAGLLEVYDANGDTLTSTDYLNCYPNYLAPDQEGFIYAYDKIDEASSAADVDDYMLTVTGKSTDGSVVYYPVTATYEQQVPISKYSSYDFATAVVTNDTADTAFNVEVVIALLDDDNNILYVDHQNYYTTTGINAGSTITYRSQINSSWTETWEREGVAPTHAEAIAYTEIRN